MYYFVLAILIVLLVIFGGLFIAIIYAEYTSNKKQKSVKNAEFSIAETHKTSSVKKYPLISHEGEDGTYFTFKIMGIWYRNYEGKERAWQLVENEPVTLVREPTNEQDENAIMVLSQGIDIGYVPRELAKDLAPIFDSYVDSFVYMKLPDGDIPEVLIRAYFSKKCNIYYRNLCMKISNPLEIKKDYSEFTDDILDMKYSDRKSYLEFVKGVLEKYPDDFFIEYCYLDALDCCDMYEEVIDYGKRLRDKYNLKQIEYIDFPISKAVNKLESIKRTIEYDKYSKIYEDGYHLMKNKEYQKALDKFLECWDSIYFIQALPKNICKCYSMMGEKKELVDFAKKAIKEGGLTENTVRIMQKYIEENSISKHKP